MKSSKHIVRETIRRLREEKKIVFSDKEVEDIFSFFMHTFYVKMREGSEAVIHIQQVGDFIIHYKELRKIISKLIYKIRYYSNESNLPQMGDIKRPEYLKKYYKMLRNALRSRNQLATHHYKLTKYYAVKKAIWLASKDQNDSVSSEEKECMEDS
jgi:hypothetical protein